MTALVEVVSVTKKGQATIPKRLREKYGIEGKVLIMEENGGIVLKPLPAPSEDLGSLKAVFATKSSRGLIEEARREESIKEKEWTKRVRAVGLRL